jgi:lysophospholipase L1-like esterase
MTRVILIGDSIRLGYQPHVTAQLEGRAEVTGTDENGGDSRRVLENLDPWVLQPEADLVHLNCGLHDLRLTGDGYQVPLEEYVHNLHEIVDRILAESGKELIWATTTPVIDERHQQVKQFERHEKDVRRYNEGALAVMSSHGVTINDLHEVAQKNGLAHLLRPDGVHFTEEGYGILARAVASNILAAAGGKGESSD